MLLTKNGFEEYFLVAIELDFAYDISGNWNDHDNGNALIF